MSFFPSLVLRWLAHLPLAALHRLGSVLGWAIYGMSPTYRRHLRENLAAARYDEARVRRRAIAAAARAIASASAAKMVVMAPRAGDRTQACRRAGRAGWVC